eukprot:Rmarinus@m.5301
MEATFNEYLQKGAIEPVPDGDKGGFYSLFFPVQKKGGKWRGCLDLRRLNQRIKCRKFKMESMNDALQLLERGDYMTSVDVSDAFLHVPVHMDFRKYLRFIWRGKAWQFRAMPFGLNIAPREFTKLMRPVVRHLREVGVHLVIYLDDILIIARTLQGSRESTRILIHTLRDLGFEINLPKSSLTPSRVAEFLGFTINSITKTISVPSEKIRGLRRSIRQALRLSAEGCLSRRCLASTVGKIVAASRAVAPARLHSRYLLHCQRAVPSDAGWDALVPLSEEARMELQWWLEHLEHFNGRTFEQQEETATLTTDASDSGWGGSATISGQATQATWGFWDSDQGHLSINARETLALLHSLGSFLPLLRGRTVLWLTDNATALAYVRNGGGRNPRLTTIAKQIWRMTSTHRIDLLPKFLPGSLNVTADRLSRMPHDPTDWQLHPKWFRRAEARWGPHTVDLFATAANAQLPRFFAGRPQPGCAGVNALAHPWGGEVPWIHPPYSLIGRVLRKLRTDGVPNATLCLPVWTAQSWWPLMTSMMVDTPILLPTDESPFLRGLGARGLRPPAWRVGVFRLSGTITKDSVSPRLPLTSRFVVGGTRPTPPRTRTGQRGCGSVTTRSIPSIRPTRPLLTSSRFFRRLRA